MNTLQVIEIATVIAAVCLVILSFKDAVQIVKTGVVNKKEKDGLKVEDVIKEIQALGLDKTAEQIKALIVKKDNKVDKAKVDMLKMSAIMNSSNKPADTTTTTKTESSFSN